MSFKPFAFPSVSLLATTLALTTCVSVPSLAQASPPAAAAASLEYVPAAKDFVGKWKIYGATVRPPADVGAAATPEQTSAARQGQQRLLGFYRAFDYLEISADGRFNFHQPGDQAGDHCMWCGKWTFHDDSLWLDLESAPRLDIYAKGGKMQMTYTSEVGEASLFRWQVVGWEPVRK
ncbi:hypothetical protein [Cupriavidus pauculus]|uniref:hypothetical protein n=1 Tax=Cupriavidus pauculus TaxID=82633 RepID=UPI001EE280E5|nr:hypothetical protein [Cupriavidus pauculus]GJG94312.1 hypothetical protein CBA19C6_07505 [Cupriavidus pauculus]